MLPGCYPDPSICRVGDDYYLVTSTFEYFPGLPIFHSRDLVHWRQIGHAIDRAGQVDLSEVPSSGGLFAATLRHHDGVFYLVNTLVHAGDGVPGGNYLLTPANPAGLWSDPVWLDDADGIDPSLFFDDDGRAWLSYTTFEHADLAIAGDVEADGSFVATVRVTNTGPREGSDVVQLYGHDVVASITRPTAQLLGYRRLALQPGESAVVRFVVPTTRLAFSDRDLVRVVEPGDVELWVGPVIRRPARPRRAYGSRARPTRSRSTTPAGPRPTCSQPDPVPPDTVTEGVGMVAMNPELVRVRAWSPAAGEVAPRVGTAPGTAEAVSYP